MRKFIAIALAATLVTSAQAAFALSNDKPDVALKCKLVEDLVVCKDKKLPKH